MVSSRNITPYLDDSLLIVSNQVDSSIMKIDYPFQRPCNHESRFRHPVALPPKRQFIVKDLISSKKKERASTIDSPGKSTDQDSVSTDTTTSFSSSSSMDSDNSISPESYIFHNDDLNNECNDYYESLLPAIYHNLHDEINDRYQEKLSESQENQGACGTILYGIIQRLNCI